MNGYSPFPTMNSLKHPQDLPSPMKLESNESIKEQKSITLVPCKVVKIFWFLKEWFPISLVHRLADVMRFVAEGIVGVLVKRPQEPDKKSGSLEIIASCSNKKRC